MAVEFRCERGYAESSFIDVPSVDMMELLFEQENNSRETESFSTHDTWTEGSNGFWL